VGCKAESLVTHAATAAASSFWASKEPHIPTSSSPIILDSAPTTSPFPLAASKMSEHHHGTTEATAAKGRFEPKEAVQLAPPKSDPISPEHLAKCTGRPLACTLGPIRC
jgi:hypothetical protein